MSKVTGDVTVVGSGEGVQRVDAPSSLFPTWSTIPPALVWKPNVVKRIRRKLLARTWWAKVLMRLKHQKIREPTLLPVVLRAKITRTAPSNRLVSRVPLIALRPHRGVFEPMPSRWKKMVKRLILILWAPKLFLLIGNVPRSTSRVGLASLTRLALVEVHC